MAFHNISETNKVYINPNFNKPTNNSYISSAVMHVNPRFPHLFPNVKPNMQNKPRIYVNPNFMKSKTTNGCELSNTNSIQEKTVTHDLNYLHPHGQPKIDERKDVSITNSRYCLVRQNVTKLLVEPVLVKSKNTFQVNKYKSIPLNDIKRNLDNTKNVICKQSIETAFTQTNSGPANKKYIRPSICNPTRNQFKLVNHNNTPVVRNDTRKMRPSIDTHKKVQFSQIRLKKGNLKKNNIPCPMYRKFGQCLRKIRGRCEFLHDRKHISICRKFIKGLCHDKECLLSHDLTTKKMPTCYFYLQGTCTKPDCPYLHVKLNEKTKICPDFLKGYCEKGSKCLQRHIQTENKVKGSSARKPPMTIKRKYNKVKTKKMLHQAEVTTDNDIKAVTQKNEGNSDCRYYQEHKNENASTETCEMIKPMRCKLGTLPSFIQL